LDLTLHFQDGGHYVILSVQQIHNLFVVDLLYNTTSAATRRSACCVDHKSDDMSRCYEFVIQLSFCCGFVV